jgi:hypothetical protein
MGCQDANLEQEGNQYESSNSEMAILNLAAAAIYC